MDKIAGFLEVGTNGNGEVIININYKTVTVDADGIGHIVFSPNQAANLARLLFKKTEEARGERP